jgi:hypothetical protein
MVAEYSIIWRYYNLFKALLKDMKQENIHSFEQKKTEEKNSCFYYIPSFSFHDSVCRARHRCLILMTGNVCITKVQTPLRITRLKDRAQKHCYSSNNLGMTENAYLDNYISI